jgi:hypothetical protein
VTKQLPHDGREFEYRIKSAGDANGLLELIERSHAGGPAAEPTNRDRATRRGMTGSGCIACLDLMIFTTMFLDPDSLQVNRQARHIEARRGCDARLE